MAKLPIAFALASIACHCSGAALELSRPVRTWEFLDATGPRAAWLGAEDGTLEAYVYPLKILDGLRLHFIADGEVIPAGSIARLITARPGHTTITYSADNFRVAETLVAPMDAPGAILLLDVYARTALRIDAEFKPEFQLMWPAAIGSGYGEWDAHIKAFRFGADGQPYAAVFGSPDAALVSRAYATNYSSAGASVITLGTIEGHVQRVLAVAASMKSHDEALAAYLSLTANAGAAVAQTAQYYRDYLARTISLDLPDVSLQSAYDWSRISEVKGFVDNPMLGRGLVAGYGPSKGAYRPGFAWFFGRDSFWTSFALTSAGDFPNARAAIAFIARFQRDDGKIPHEISQSAALLDWFHQFPYGYASADATPLYIIATAEYVRAGGDVAFAREQAPRLWKALEFMHSTLDDAGFPKNLSVGHGWVEGGPLLPVRTELYQAGCYVEALRSLAGLATVLHDDARRSALQSEYEQKRHALDERFWLPDAHAYAFALDTSGKPVAQPSVLATVPMWFDLLDRAHSQEMIARLAEEQHSTDWGMRIISAHAALYDPSGYHYGSVWPLFTGWASVGEYRNHAAEAALANLRANAWLSLDGAGGNTTEVLSGDTYSPLSTASPHQIWSAAMVVSPILRGMLGLEIDAARKQIVFAPHLPVDWPSVAVHNIPVGEARISLELRRDPKMLELKIDNPGSQVLDLEFAPAYPPCARVTSATLNGGAATWKTDSETLDWHPRFRLSIKPGANTLTIHHQDLFGYAVPYTPPRLAEPSMNLKVVSEHWSNSGRTLALTVSGRASHDYRLQLVNGDLAARVEGASKDSSGNLQVRMPDGPPDDYVNREITISLAGERVQ